jgi:hypothetical protein
MISVVVISQDEKRVVLEGTVDGYPQLTQRWTISAAALAVNPGLLAQGRDELLNRLQVNYDNWQGVLAGLQEMQ